MCGCGLAEAVVCGCGRSTAGVGERLGMSFEMTDLAVADSRSRLWILTKVTFTGAAILRRDRAAYEDTWIELSAS